MSCTRAQGYLARHQITAKEIVDAKASLGPEEALKLAAGATKLVVAKGKKIASFSLKKNRPDDDTLLAHMLGPTGNLRAPTVRRGKTLLVGFNEEVYAAEL